MPRGERQVGRYRVTSHPFPAVLKELPRSKSVYKSKYQCFMTTGPIRKCVGTTSNSPGCENAYHWNYSARRGTSEEQGKGKRGEASHKTQEQSRKGASYRKA